MAQSEKQGNTDPLINSIGKKVLIFLVVAVWPPVGLGLIVGLSDPVLSLISIWIAVSLIFILWYLILVLLSRALKDKAEILAPHLAALPFVYLPLLVYILVFILPGYYNTTSPLGGFFRFVGVFFFSTSLPAMAGFALMSAAVACLIGWFIGGLVRKESSPFPLILGAACIIPALLIPFLTSFAILAVGPGMSFVPSSDVSRHISIGLVLPWLLRDSIHSSIAGNLADILYLSSMAFLAPLILLPKGGRGVAAFYGIMISVFLLPLSVGLIRGVPNPVSFAILVMMFLVGGAVWFGLGYGMKPTHTGWGALTLVFALVIMGSVAYPIMAGGPAGMRADFSSRQSWEAPVPPLGTLGLAVSIDYSAYLRADPPFASRFFQKAGICCPEVVPGDGSIDLSLDGERLGSYPFDPFEGRIDVPSTFGALALEWMGDVSLSSSESQIDAPGFLQTASTQIFITSQYDVEFFLTILQERLSLGTLTIEPEPSELTLRYLPIEDVMIILAFLSGITAALSGAKLSGQKWVLRLR